MESVEQVEAIEISSIFEIRDATSPDSETIFQFFEAITLSEEQAKVIFEKTKSQGETEFWKTQRTGRVTASNFYKICHLRDSTNKDNTLKELLIIVPFQQTNSLSNSHGVTRRKRKPQSTTLKRFRRSTKVYVLKIVALLLMFYGHTLVPALMVSGIVIAVREG